MGRRAGCSPAIVAAAFFAILEHCTASDQGVSSWDADAFALFAGVDRAVISELVDLMTDAKIIEDDQLAVLARPGRDRTQAERARRYRERSKTVTASRRTVTANRDERGETVTASRQTVTASRSFLLADSATGKTVTANRDERDGFVTANRDGKGGDIGGGKVASSSCSVETLSQSDKRERENAHALADEMIEKLTAAGAVRSPMHAELVRPRVRAWVGQGIQASQLDAAIEMAKAARIAAGSQQPLNVGYIEAKLANTPAMITTACTARPDAARPAANAAHVDLAAFSSWVRQRVDFGAISAAEGEAMIQAERVKLGLASAVAA